MSRANKLFGIAVLVWVLAWFVQVVKDGVIFPHGLPGWEAFRAALTIDNPRTILDAILSRATALTNFVFLWAIVVGFRNKPAPKVLGVLLFVCAVVNLFWLSMSDALGSLRAGYYMWLVSYWMMAVAARDRGTRG